MAQGNTSQGGPSQGSPSLRSAADAETTAGPGDAVDQLLKLGDPDVNGRGVRTFERLNYLDRGLTPADVPRLIHLADQWYGGEMDWEHVDWSTFKWDDPHLWAPVHAWRALGQLRAVEAVEPLLEMLNRARQCDDDWAMSDLPEVFASMGPLAIEPLGRYLLEPAREQYARSAAGDALVKIAKAFPETRSDCVACVTDALRQADGSHTNFNAFLLANLLGLQATESAETIERAFAANLIDESICGDWYEVRAVLKVKGLGLVPPQRQQPRRPRIPIGLPGDLPNQILDPNKKRLQKQKEKAKRKQQQQAKKRNRRAR